MLGAARILCRNSLQSSLAILGILVGVGAVIAMVSIGQGAKSVIHAQVASIGTNVIFILPGATTVGGVRGGLGGSAVLTVADSIELKKRVPLLHEVAWVKRQQNQAVHGNRNWTGQVFGVMPSFFAIRDWPVISGGAITDADVETGAQVALLGQTVVGILFEPGEEPVGALIRIKNMPFRIIGVLAPKGQSSEGMDQDDVIYVPFMTAERKLFGAHFPGLVGAVLAATEREEDVRRAVEEIRRVLRERHRLPVDRLDDFTVRTQLDIAKVQEESSRTLTVMLLAIAAISTLVGGIGIMNILLVSVTERTKEIGIRMAVGARRWQILLGFLLEATILSLFGGVLGVVFGVLAAKVVTIMLGWPTLVSVEAISVAIIFSVSIGLFFGLYPANKAARLEPIEALRYK